MNVNFDKIFTGGVSINKAYHMGKIIWKKEVVVDLSNWSDWEEPASWLNGKLSPVAQCFATREIYPVSSTDALFKFPTIYGTAGMYITTFDSNMRYIRRYTPETIYQTEVNIPFEPNEKYFALHYSYSKYRLAEDEHLRKAPIITFR
ncbi:MAG: hypothetical protein GXZ11_01275 [Tissierellia bacterium]|nr:hypothetical protein [Tissierellia bacterium]